MHTAVDTATYGPNMLLADLSLDHEAAIKATVADLQAQFEKKYDISYEHFMQDTLAEHEMLTRSAAKLASRINLGEHLLATIANMRAASIKRQQLTIER